MEWLTDNGFFVLIFLAFIAMHLFGHGGHGGQRGDGGDEGDADPGEDHGLEGNCIKSSRVKTDEHSAKEHGAMHS